MLRESPILDTASTLRLVAKSWAYLKLLDKEKLYVSELASRLNKKAPEATDIVSDLARTGFVTKQKRQGARQIDCFLTNRGRAWVNAISALDSQGGPREQYADSEEVKFLLSVVRSPPTPESLEEAENRLVKTITTKSRISKSDAETLVSVAEKHLSHTQRERWSRWLSIVQAVEKNTNDKTIRLLLQRNIIPLVINLLDTTELQGSSRKIATDIARDLMGEQKWHATLRKLVEAKTKQVPAEEGEKWSLVEDSWIESLNQMFTDDKINTLTWLFELMKPPKEEHVRQRAQQLIQRIG